MKKDKNKLDFLNTLRAAIKEEMQQRTNFLISFAHDAKHLLSIMQVRLHALYKEAGGKKLPSLPLLEDDHNRLSVLFSNILDTEKILQQKKLYEHTTLLNISNHTASVIDVYKNIAEENNIQVIQDIEKDLFIQISPQAFDRVLGNIIDNAIKYSSENGTIHISVKGDDKSVLLSIQDTGIGIPDDQHKKLFAPYFQVAREKKYDYGGIGAGLFIVKRILDEVSGKIKVRSKAGKGTTVTCVFSRKEGDTIDTEKTTCRKTMLKPILRKKYSVKPETFKEGKETILFVEDDMELLFIIQNEVEKEYNIYCASNGVDAVKKLDDIPKPDIIISGIVMEPGDGYAFLEKMKEIKDMEDIPFIFLSGKTAPGEIRKGLQCGAVDYITKPFHMEILKEKIKTLLRNRRIHTEKEITRMEQRISEVIRTRDMEVFKFSLKAEKYHLSKQEKKVMKYLLKGFTIPEIAGKLSLSQHTVRNHVRHIYIKCDVNNRTRLMLLFNK